MPDTLVNGISRPFDTEPDLIRFWQPSIQQALFRNLLAAFSYPGQSQELAENDAAVAILATLVDAETTLADPNTLLTDLTRTRLSATVVTAERASFVIARGDAVPDFTPQLGTLESPEFGATLIVMVDSLSQGKPFRLTGPGIETSQRISVNGLDEAWIRARNTWCDSFPLGVDLLLTDQTHCLALPRTTLIEAWGGA